MFVSPANNNRSAAAASRSDVAAERLMELRLEDDPASLREHTCYGSCTSDPHQLEPQLEDDPSLREQIKCYGINTAKHQLELPEQTCYESTCTS